MCHKCISKLQENGRKMVRLDIMSKREKKGCRGMESIFEKLGGIYHLGEDGV